MLKNETYAGIRYFNRITAATEANRQGKEVIRGKWVLRDRVEWIAVKVPAIVSRELFDQVQARLRLHEERYCQPVTHYLLSGLVECGGLRCPVFFFAPLPQSPAPLGEGVGVSPCRVPL